MGNHHDDLARLASFFGGEEAINVVKALAQAGTTTDDVIATQANVRLNTARKVLYKLYDHALVTCVRSRDEKTGCFICKGCPDSRVTFEDAMESAFRCGGCNGQLVSDDNTRTIQMLEDHSRKLESELSEGPVAFADGRF